jgi:signal transduction histidine kinase
MTPAESHIGYACLHLVPALLWGIVAWDAGRLVVLRGLRSTRWWLVTLIGAFSAVHFGLHTLIELAPNGVDGRYPGLAGDVAFAITLTLLPFTATLLHLVPFLPLEAGAPHRRWLAINYGTAAVLAMLVIVARMAPDLLPVDRHVLQRTLPAIYTTVAPCFAVWRIARYAGPGWWGAGVGVGELRQADLLIAVGAVAGAGSLLWLFGRQTNIDTMSLGGRLVHTAVGLVLVVPFAARMLGELIRGFLLSAAVLVTATVVVGAAVAAAPAAGPEGRRLLVAGAAIVVLLFLAVGRAPLTDVVERALFGRGRRQREELAEFVQGLAPELGARECARRGLGRLVAVLRVRGAAILFADGGSECAGALDVASLAADWPRVGGGTSLPVRPMMGPELLELPADLRRPLIAAEIVALAPVVGPRRRWGDLFLTDSMFSGPVTAEGAAAVEGFAAQLALILDAAELLERALGVERALAHAEKLAAIGETAARIAHDVRNPVAAARSLAQQLVQAPGSADAGELAAVIVEEMERVERRIAALLRFARREDPRPSAVDLGALVERVAAQLERRAGEAGAVVDARIARDVVVRADAEQLRHVVINLVENALDAVGAAPGERRVRLEVGGADGSATLRVADTGPGVAADALPRLFEPFFSLKPHGTGLGLAIAKRTVEAHGGRITAASGPDGGMTFEVVLPRTAAEDAA